MKDYILTFRTAVHRAKDDDISDDSEFVNNFMWEHSLYGKDIYDKLLHEIKTIKEMPKNMRVKLYNNTTFNNVLWAKIKDNTLIMSQKTPMEGVKEVRIFDVKVEDIQFMDNKIMIL